MKIIIASETFPTKTHIDGCAVFTERLAKGLAARGHQVLAIGPNSEFKDSLDREGPNLKVFRLKSFLVKPVHPRFRFIYNIDLFWKLKKVVKNFNPDIIHIQNHMAVGRILVSLAKKMMIPIGGTNHFMPENLIQWMPFGKEETSKIMWLDFCRVFDKLDFVTTPTQAAADLLRKIGFYNDIVIISNGIDLKKFKKRPVKDLLWEKYDLDKKLRNFIFVGRIDKDKNVNLAIKSFSIALKKSKMQFLVVGVGPKENEYKNLAKKLGVSKYVKFTGKVSEEELRALYCMADVCVAPGEAELQGIAIMEAMACGLPVIGLNAVAIPELVKDGVNGYIFEKNAQDLGKKMLEIFRDKKKLNLMRRNSLRMIKRHEFSNTLKKFEELYKKTIEEYKN